MNEQLVDVAIKVLVDGQAVLYSQIMGFQQELYGQPPTEEELLHFQEDWKEKTAELIEEMLGAKANYSN